MSDDTSVRPARLMRHEETLAAVAEGLRRRATILAEASANYVATCDAEFRASTSDAAPVVRNLADDLEEFGRWTGDVGRAAVGADMCFIWGPNPDDPEDVFRVLDSTILAGLRNWTNPYRTVQAGAARQLAHDMGIDFDPDGPPAWVSHLANGGTLAGIADGILKARIRVLEGLAVTVPITVRVEQVSVSVFSNGDRLTTYSRTDMAAQLRVGGQAPAHLHRAAKYVGRIGTVASFASGAYEQWSLDEDRPTGQRVGRAVVRGGVPTAAGAAGGTLAAALCVASAPVCAVAAIGTGLLVAAGADRLVDGLLNPDPKPGEYDLDIITDTIAYDGDDAEIMPELQSEVDDTLVELLLENPVPEPVEFIGPRLLPECDTKVLNPMSQWWTRVDEMDAAPFPPEPQLIGPTHERAEALGLD